MRRVLAVIVLAATRLGAQQAHEPKPIQDNSFLLEEAYNQEAGVVQHISNLFFDRTVASWLYAFTDEWPVGGQRHQLSATIPILANPVGHGASIGDVALNYRLQLAGSGETRLAITPRLTAILPTASGALGGGTFAVQAALASSLVATPALVLHTNVGLTTTPGVDAPGGGQATLLDVMAGQSIVWLVHPRVNLMLEGVVTSTQDFTGVGTATRRSTGVTLSPGVRWSYDFPSGLQIVPGFAFPLGFRANSGQRGVFLYLSFEHPMPGLRR
ncbi:MAG TPA: hypothetical protein VJ867_12235 [Gemmatimonadaceae bacterium]|nr:hypothetical protein [Gemmatimonadaceae bacterium]